MMPRNFVLYPSTKSCKIKKNLNPRFLTLTVSMIMAVAVMMIAPAIVGTFSQ